MKAHFVYINKVLIFGFFFVVLNVPTMSYSKAEEDKHADHKEHGDEHEHAKEEVKEVLGKESHDEHGEEEEGQEEGIIELDPEAQEMVKLETAPVEKRVVENRLKVFGKIAKDTDEHSYVTANEGVIETIYVELGATVEKGDKLLTIRKSDGSRQDVLADIPGVILATYVKPGDHADHLKSLMSIINIDKLRVTVDVYEKDIGFVKVGQKAEIESIAFPERKFLGEVVYISPQVEEESQAIKVRIDVDNSEHQLRLGMFISGDLISESENEVISVPISAIQELNEENIVFIMTDNNKFALTEVALGHCFGDYVEIKNGLDEGQKVVTQGSFYLKSEQAKESFGEGHNH